MSDWEKIISFESLYKAHRRARLSKRHKKEVVEFENNLSENLWKLHYELKYGKYKISGYRSFMIYDPKKREIQAISYRDRVVQHSLCDNYLIPLLEKKLIYDNVACRKKKGSSLAFKRLREFMTEHYKKYGEKGYFIKLDVKKYFNTIDHVVLKEKLKTIVTDDNILRLLFFIIDSYCFSDNRGLPMGNQSSQCFALLYLDGVDKFIKRSLKVTGYVRYMDDFILLTDERQSAVGYLNKTSDSITRLNIDVNGKSQIIPIKNGIGFLGWRFRFLKDGKISQTLKKDTRRRILCKVKTLRFLFKTNKKSGKKLMQSMVSYKGFTCIAMGKRFYYGKVLYYLAGRNESIGA